MYALCYHKAMNPAEEQIEEEQIPVLRPNQKFEAFLAACEAEKEGEAKLNRVIDFMEEALSQDGSPHFKNFWELAVATFGKIFF